MGVTSFAMISYCISFITYISYVIVCRVRYGSSMDCLSSTYYLNKRKWVFTAFIMLISFFLLPSWLELSGDSYAFLAFLSTVCLSCVGLFPKYLGDDRKMHIASVIVSAILSIIWNIASGIYIPLSIAVVILLLYKLIFRDRDMTLITEILAFLNIYSSIIMALF